MSSVEAEIDGLLLRQLKASIKFSGTTLAALLLFVLVIGCLVGMHGCSERKRFAGSSPYDEFQQLVLEEEGDQAVIWLCAFFATACVTVGVLLGWAGEVLVYKVLLQPSAAWAELSYKNQPDRDDSTANAALGCVSMLVAIPVLFFAIMGIEDGPGGWERAADRMSWLILAFTGVVFLRFVYGVAKRTNFSQDRKLTLRLEWGRGYLLSGTTAIAELAIFAFFLLPPTADALASWVGDRLEQRLERYERFDCRDHPECTKLRSREKKAVIETLSRPILLSSLPRLEFIVSAKRLNVRQGASSDSPRSGTLQRGDRVLLAEVSGDWARLTGTDPEGWVHLDFMQTDLGWNFRVLVEWLAARVVWVFFVAVVPLFIGIPLLCRWVELSVLGALGVGLVTTIAARGLEILVVDRLGIVEAGSLGLLLLIWVASAFLAVVLSRR